MAKPKKTTEVAPAAAPAAAPVAPVTPTSAEAAPAAPVAPAAPAAPPPVEKTKMPEQNGVTKPAPGTMTGKVWDIADEITAKQGRPATRAEVVTAAVSQSTNKSTATTQFGKWAKFHGHVADKAPGRPPGAATPAPAAAPAAAPVNTTLPGAPVVATEGVGSTGSTAHYDEGFDAYQKSNGTATNPYAPGTHESNEWQRGATAAYEAAAAAYAAQQAQQPA